MVPPTEIPQTSPIHEPPPKVNNTEAAIKQEVAAKGGQIPYSGFMRLSLYGPDGFYSSGKVRIAEDPTKKEVADFTTSPEATEVFSVTLGNSLRQTWEAMGKPETFRVVEMGAGEGTLASSLLDWSEKLYPDFYKTIRYTIVEIGALAERQRKKIAPHHNINWIHGSATELNLSDIEGAFISNELVDAFPVEQVTQQNGSVKQKYISHDGKKFVQTWAEPTAEVSQFLAENKVKTAEGLVTAVNLQAAQFQKRVDAALKRGAIITIDYGNKGIPPADADDAVWCMQKSKVEKHDVQFENVGNVDITSNVDFGVLERIAAADGLETEFSGNQFEFLLQAGLVDAREVLLELAKHSSSWPEVLRIYEQTYLGSINNLTKFNKFYAHMLVKGIDDIILKERDGKAEVERLDTRPFELPLRLGNEGESVSAHLNYQRFVKYKLDETDKAAVSDEDPKTAEFELNSDGKISIDPPTDIQLSYEDRPVDSAPIPKSLLLKDATHALMEFFRFETEKRNPSTLGFYDSKGNLIFALGQFVDHPDTPEKKQKLEEYIAALKPEEKIVRSWDTTPDGTQVPIDTEHIVRTRQGDDVIEDITFESIDHMHWSKTGEVRPEKTTRQVHIARASHLDHLTQQDLQDRRVKIIQDSGFNVD